MTDAALLGVPLGGPGSGRNRYGVAMGLYQSGQISAAALEAYRVAAARDAEHPFHVLQERNLPLPGAVQPPPDVAIRALVDEACRYISALPGNGIAEARQGIARFRDGPCRTVAATTNAVVEAWLPAALATLDDAHPALSQLISLASPHLQWVTYDLYPHDRIGPDFPRNHAFASLMGEEGAIASVDFDMGLFLMAPHVLYRDHRHPAPELYAPLTGPHGWRFAPDTPLQIKPAHQPVWNPPNRPHLTKVGPVPFLCIFVWTRDTACPAEVLSASDWPELEALRLEP